MHRQWEMCNGFAVGQKPFVMMCVCVFLSSCSISCFNTHTHTHTLSHTHCERFLTHIYATQRANAKQPSDLHTQHSARCQFHSETNKLPTQYKVFAACLTLLSASISGFRLRFIYPKICWWLKSGIQQQQQQIVQTQQTQFVCLLWSLL